MSIPNNDFLRALEKRRESIRATTESWVLECRSQNREMNAGEQARFTHAANDLEALNSRIDDYRNELQRVGTIPDLGSTGRQPGGGRINCRPGCEVMPLDFDVEQLRGAHQKVLRQEPALLETRAFNTASPELPAQLYPIPTFPIHPDRIADRLPAFALDYPSLEYVQVNSVTGAAAAVAEGAVKPEVTLNVTQLVATAVKLAAHLGLSWESMSDFDAFTSSATTELQRLVIDKENEFILAWLNTAGILTHAAVGTPQFDDIEEAIAELRSGPSLAVADLLVLSPSTWSALRREKNLQGTYYVAADPSVGEVSSIWGVPVVSTTVCPDGEGWLLDTTKFGRLAVRESLSVRIGFANDDFVRNIVRYVCEERCILTVERPSAVLHLTGLTATTTTTKASAKK
jgi:hypothetical protein